MDKPFGRNLFIDSGAHGLYNEHVFRVKRNALPHDQRYQWFWTGEKFTPEFVEYLDTYAEFVKRFGEGLDLYANVDTIFSPKLTWLGQQYLEEYHGLRPVPVIHYGTPMKWLEKYLAKDYSYIALGGIGQEISQSVYQAWADRAFERICDQPSREPLTKVHGFAMTAVKFMRRWPWYSVDSTTWLTFGSYGQIIMPPFKQGKWNYEDNYIIHRVSLRHSKAFNKASMANTLKKEQQRLFFKYIEEKGFVLGKSEKNEDGEEVVIEKGLVNDDKRRTELNALYFIDFADSLPEWPWPFIRKEKPQPFLIQPK